MKIVIPGGSGQIGTLLARAFRQRGHDVVVLARGRVAAPWRVVSWDGRTLGRWVQELEGAGVVINLAGRSVDCRYTDANRAAILNSRVESTAAIGEAIAAVSRPPRVWLQASTATIYAHTFGPPQDEATGTIGGHEPDAPPQWRFSIDVATRWEQALAAARTPRTRKVALRSAMTMSPEAGGVFAVLRRLVRLGLGGPAGDGRQFVSWIHYRDFIAAMDWLIDHDDLEGAVNVCAPGPVTNREFMRDLRAAFGVPVGLPCPRWMLEIGAAFIRTETELLLKSRRVVPGRLLDSGFRFTFGEWAPAARDLAGRSLVAFARRNE